MKKLTGLLALAIIFSVGASAQHRDEGGAVVRAFAREDYEQLRARRGLRKLVFDGLDRLREGETSIVIAHRRATIQLAETIFVVDDGKIVESGSHNELLKLGGLYAGLYEIQFRPTMENLAPPSGKVTA